MKKKDRRGFLKEAASVPCAFVLLGVAGPFKSLAEEGGEGPMFSLVVMHDNWVSFKTPEKTVLSILEDAFGRQGADQVMETFWDCIARQEINVLRYRADLSYVPSR